MNDFDIKLNIPFQLMLGSLTLERKNSVTNALFHLLGGLDKDTMVSTLEIDLTTASDRKEYMKVIKFLIENGVICVVDTNQYSFNPLFIEDSPYLGKPFNNLAFPKMDSFADFMDRKVIN